MKTGRGFTPHTIIAMRLMNCSRLMLAAITATAIATLVQPASAAVVYSNDFSGSAGPEWSHPTIATSNGERFLGASADGFGNGTVTLSLSSLPAHSSVTVGFDLYVIRSWDGNGTHCCGPDNWQLTANGASLYFTNFANYTLGNTQAFPNQLPPFGSGGSFSPRTGAFENGHLGLGTGNFGDATYRFSISFPQSDPHLSLAFAGFTNQPPDDEGWGLDNVTVDALVPEPATWWLAAVAAVLLGMRRKRSRTMPCLLAAALAIFVLVPTPPVQAEILDGKTITTRYEQVFPHGLPGPDITIDSVVGPGVEVSGYFFGLDVDFSDTNILITNRVDGVRPSETFFWIEDAHGTIPRFTGVTINPASTWTAVDSSKIYFNADEIHLSVWGLSGLAGQQISLDLTAMIPEPATWLLAAVATAFLGIRRRRSALH